MRKSELRLKAERGVNTWGNATLLIYKAQQFRWEDGETADPQVGDVSYHLTKEEAIATAKKLKLDIGFEAQIECIALDYNSVNDGIDFGEQFELSYLDNYKKFDANPDIIWVGVKNDGEKLDPEAIVVIYRHHMYMNYAYIIERVEFVKYTQLTTEADLRNDSDRTFSTYFEVFANINELAESFENGNQVPFNKINSGSRLIKEFLTENEHPDYLKIEEIEDEY